MAGLTELKRPETLVVATARHIGDAIVTGTYAPETALPETSLAKDIGVSRGTVREALRLLAEDGLVEIVPHRGACVAPMNARTIRETFSLRAVLESFAARLAVESGRVGAAIDTIEEAHLEVERAVIDENVNHYVEADRTFHETISRLSDHSALLEVLAALRPRVRRFSHWGRSHQQPAPWASHADIVAALRAGDPELAATTLQRHILRGGEMLVARVEELTSPQSVRTGVADQPVRQPVGTTPTG
jgi:DNA-binding GntR family transcriptional regulator